MLNGVEIKGVNYSELVRTSELYITFMWYIPGL